MLTMVGIISAYRNRKPVEKDGPLTLDLSKAKIAETEVAPEPTPELRRELAELALLHAVLADRAGSESFVQTKILPEGVEVITRRRHLDLLREYDVYGRLGNVERDLLLQTDGHWTQQAINDVSMSLEPLRLLRWVLRVDDFLPTVGSHLKAEYRLAGELVKEPERLFKSQTLVEISALRTGTEAADVYFYRCWAEGVRRGFYQSEDEEETKRLREYAVGLEGREDEDFLLGSTIVNRASDEDVRLATTLAFRRAFILRWICQRIYGEQAANELLEAFFLR